MCCRTLSKLWDIESPKHASFAAFARGGKEKKKPLPVRFTLISAWNQKRERMEGEDAVVFIVAAEVALAHTWPFVAAAAASTGAVYVASFVCVCACVCDPDLSPGAFMDVFIEGFHWSSPRCLPPHEPRQFILNRPVPRERAGGRLKPAGSLFFFVVLVGFFLVEGGEWHSYA